MNTNGFSIVGSIWTMSTASLLSALLGSTAYAQMAAPATAAPPGASAGNNAISEGLEEVIVTATKNKGDAQSAPASITALSGAILAQEGISDTLSLEKLVPSANLRSEGPVTQAFIRGVGSNLDVPYVDPGVVYLYNGVTIPRYGTGGLVFDLDDVEIISGPQGTLYGGSAAGGAINVNATRPGFNSRGSATLEFGNYGSFLGSVAQNIPVNDILAVRAAFNYSEHSGYQNNGFDAPRDLSGRLSILANPSENFTAYAWYSGYHGTGQNYVLVTNPLVKPGNPWYAPPNDILGNPIVQGSNPRDYLSQMLGGQFDWRIGDVTLTYIPGYVSLHDLSHIYLPVLPYYTTDKENQTTQELRLATNTGPVKWIAGVYYLRDRIDFSNVINGLTLFSSQDQLNTNASFYGQGIYSVTDELNLTFGGRFSYDDKKVPNGYTFPVPGPFTFSHSADHGDFKLGADYRVGPQLMLYANVQTGYVPFGYAQSDVKIPEERLLSFSGGEKARFFDSRLEVNDEAYYYIYRDYQIVSINPATGVQIVVSPPKSVIYGDELTTKFLLTPSDNFNLGANIMSAKYVTFGIYSNYDMTDSPRANITAGYKHTFDLPGGSKFVGDVQTHYESGHYTEYDHLPYTHQAAYTKTDLSLTYFSPGERWNVGAYVRNVENAAVFGALNNSGPVGAGFLEPPRTFGIRVAGNWGR
jgi:iron complex outermembrane recepter protein